MGKDLRQRMLRNIYPHFSLFPARLIDCHRSDLCSLALPEIKDLRTLSRTNSTTVSGNLVSSRSWFKTLDFFSEFFYMLSMDRRKCYDYRRGLFKQGYHEGQRRMTNA